MNSNILYKLWCLPYLSAGDVELDAELTACQRTAGLGVCTLNPDTYADLAVIIVIVGIIVIKISCVDMIQLDEIALRAEGDHVGIGGSIGIKHRSYGVFISNYRRGLALSDLKDIIILVYIMGRLDKYNKKRNFDVTTEPKGKKKNRSAFRANCCR